MTVFEGWEMRLLGNRKLCQEVSSSFAKAAEDSFLPRESFGGSVPPAVRGQVLRDRGRDFCAKA